ncbi:MAG: hypothetical protein CMF25_06365 [Kangiellaceae bacterium]|nr:hypothetical protein [Kangiellaceae bacterium]|tara:strand:+ start:7978 stop:8880 length:903 start_codon:yes stop_codon:yes gene_type:complete
MKKTLTSSDSINQQSEVGTCPAPLGTIRLQGEGHKKLLQGQLTCDINELSDSLSMYGAWCNPKGRIIASVLVVQDGNDILLITPIDMLDITKSLLEKYAPFYQITVADISSQTAISLSAKAKAENDTQHMHTIHTNSKLTISWGVSGRFELIIAKETPPAKIDDNDWWASQISEGVAWIRPETTEQYLPLHINLHRFGGVSFKKGCYTGQEVIARMHYKSQLKKRMYRLSAPLSVLPANGNELIDSRTDKMIGTIVCSAKVGQDTVEMLAEVMDESIDHIQLKNYSLVAPSLLSLPYSNK